MNKDCLKLFEIELQGNIERFRPVFVVAHSPDEAYDKVRKWLDENKYGDSSERELNYIRLIAEDYRYTDAKSRLFI